MALGAKKSDIFRMVIGQGLRLGLAGLAVGGAVAQVVTRVLSSFSHLLYRVGANDPTTFAAVSVVLIGVAFLACYIPARRAANVDPIVALRHE
jgi:putative ABC transport system permease protein